MTGKELFEGMSYVDERFVDEAENKTIPKRIVSPWPKVASMAACLCLIVFSVYNLNRYINRGETEGAADQAWPGEGMESGVESEMQQESQESSIIVPEDSLAGEVPSVILRVDDMTNIGFTGTVAELVDTDIFEIGMELNVVIAEGIRHETAEGSPSVSADSKTDMTGRYVMVQFIHYNKDTGTILVNIIQEVEPPEDTP